MEKKKGLSAAAEQMPLATVGTVLRSQPAFGGGAEARRM
jgi:hypothetical protein